MLYIGTMGLESRNNFMNRFCWKFGHQGIILAMTNAEIFKLSANWKCLQYWLNEESKPVPQRKQPQYPTFVQLYPQQFEHLSKAYGAIFSLKLFDNLFKANDGKYHLITNIEYDEKRLKDKIYEMMLLNELKFDKDDEKWTHNHKNALWLYLMRYHDKAPINNKILREVSTFFNDKFHLDLLWEVCKSIGWVWESKVKK